MQGQSWKTTGPATIVRHTLLWSIPGFHLGIIFITRKASLSSKGSTEVLTFTSDTVPSLLTINETTTMPCILRC